MAHIRQMLSLRDVKLKKSLSRIKHIVESRTSISKDLNMWMHLVKGDAKFSRRMKLDSSYYNKAMANKHWKVDLNDMNMEFMHELNHYSQEIRSIKDGKGYTAMEAAEKVGGQLQNYKVQTEF